MPLFVVKTIFQVQTGNAVAAVNNLEKSYQALAAAEANARKTAAPGVIHTTAPTFVAPRIPAAAVAPLLVSPTAVPAIAPYAPAPVAAVQPVLRASASPRETVSPAIAVASAPGSSAIPIITAQAREATAAVSATTTALGTIAPALPTSAGALPVIAAQATSAHRPIAGITDTASAAQDSLARLDATDLGHLRASVGTLPSTLIPTGSAATTVSRSVASIASAASGAASSTSTSTASMRGSLGFVAASAGQAAQSVSAIGNAPGVVPALRRIEPPLRDAASAARTLGHDGTQAMSRLGNGASSLQSRLMGIAGAYLGINTAQRLIGGAVTQQVNLETQTIAASAMINANVKFYGDHDFGRSMGLAKQQLNELAIKARQLPGTFEDYSTIYGAIAGPLSAGGERVDQFVAKSADVGVMAKLIRQNAYDASNQVNRMLTGQAGADNPFAMYLQNTGLLKREFTEFNQLPLAERIKETFAAIGTVSRDPRTLAAIAASAETQFSTLKDNVTGINGVLGIAGRTIKDQFVASARTLNTWFERNPQKVQWIADTISGYVVPAIRAGERLLLSALDNAQGIEKALIGAAVAASMIHVAQMVPGPAIGTGATVAAGTAAAGNTGYVASMLPGAQVLTNLALLGTAAKGLSSARIAGATGSALSGIATGGVAAGRGIGRAAIGAAGIAVTFVPAVMANLGGTGAGTQLMAPFVAMLPSISAISVALPPVAVGLLIVGAVVAGVAGAFLVVKNNVLGLGEMFTVSGGMLTDSLGRLGGNLLTLFKALAYPLGVVIVPALSAAAVLLASGIDILNWFLNVIGGGVAYISALLGALSTGNFKGANKVAAEEWKNFSLAKVFDEIEASNKKARATTEQERRDAAAGAAPVNQTFHNTFQIQGEGVSASELSREVALHLARMARRGSTEPQGAY